MAQVPVFYEVPARAVTTAPPYRMSVGGWFVVFLFGGLIGLWYATKGWDVWGSIWRAWRAALVICLVTSLLYAAILLIGGAL